MSLNTPARTDKEHGGQVTHPQSQHASNGLRALPGDRSPWGLRLPSCSVIKSEQPPGREVSVHRKGAPPEGPLQVHLPAEPV